VSAYLPHRPDDLGGRERIRMMEYSELVRARMVRRMVGTGASAATELSLETCIPQSTLSQLAARRG
jgi:hypothetical protein